MPSELVLFQVASQHFAILAADVKEVVRAVKVDPIAIDSEAVEGVINVRGAVMPVVNLRKFFRYPQVPLNPYDQFLITEKNNSLLVFRTDQVLGIEEISLEHAAVSHPLTEEKHILKILNTSAGITVLLELEAFDSELIPISLNELLEQEISSPDALKENSE